MYATGRVPELSLAWQFGSSRLQVKHFSACKRIRFKPKIRQVIFCSTDWSPWTNIMCPLNGNAHLRPVPQLRPLAGLNPSHNVAALAKVKNNTAWNRRWSSEEPGEVGNRHHRLGLFLLVHPSQEEQVTKTENTVLHTSCHALHLHRQAGKASTRSQGSGVRGTSAMGGLDLPSDGKWSEYRVPPCMTQVDNPKCSGILKGTMPEDGFAPCGRRNKGQMALKDSTTASQIMFKRVSTLSKTLQHRTSSIPKGFCAAGSLWDQTGCQESQHCCGVVPLLGKRLILIFQGQVGQQMMLLHLRHYHPLFQLTVKGSAGW